MFTFFYPLEFSYESEYNTQDLFGICIKDRNPFLSGHLTAASFMETNDKANLELRTGQPPSQVLKESASRKAKVRTNWSLLHKYMTLGIDASFS